MRTSTKYHALIANILGGYYFRARTLNSPTPLLTYDNAWRLVEAAATHNAQAFTRAATEDPDFVEGDDVRWAVRVSEPFGEALFDWVLANNAIPDDEQIRMVLDWVLVQAGYSPGAVA